MPGKRSRNISLVRLVAMYHRYRAAVALAALPTLAAPPTVHPAAPICAWALLAAPAAQPKRIRQPDFVTNVANRSLRKHVRQALACLLCRTIFSLSYIVR